MDFAGRTVMVTGAAGNLGRAVAQAFATRGARLVLVDLDGKALEAAFGTAGAAHDNTLLLPVNLLVQDEVNAAIQATLARFQRIDVLCNLAGGFRMGDPVHATTDRDWNFLFDINTRTFLHTARAVTPHMIEAGGGKVVNIGAFTALRGAAHMGAYTAAKSALIRLTEAMAAELRDRNINVNCVLPSIIDTPENRAAMPDANPAHWVTPGDLAGVIAFLASDAARAVHGAAIPVTGLS